MQKSDMIDLIKSSISRYFANKPDGLNLPNFHVLNYIFPKQRQARSLIGGLETSFGKRLWQPLAAAITNHNTATTGLTVIPISSFNKTYFLTNPLPAAVAVRNHWAGRRASNLTQQNFAAFIGLTGYIADLKNVPVPTNANFISGKMKKGSTANFWVKKGNDNFIYKISTNKLNTSGGITLNNNIMDWHMSTVFLKPQETFTFQAVFPFDPYPNSNPGFWDIEKKKISPLKPGEDALLADDFWDFISGKPGTAQLIEEAFSDIGKTTFAAKFALKFG